MKAFRALLDRLDLYFEFVIYFFMWLMKGDKLDFSYKRVPAHLLTHRPPHWVRMLIACTFFVSHPLLVVCVLLLALLGFTILALGTVVYSFSDWFARMVKP